MTQIQNPVLTGFHPDPSILRVGEDYYLATSTFEWFPGVRIHHSRDLVHWRTIKPALRRSSQLDMRGNPNSCGIWAPCLTHDGEQFHLIYTDVKTWNSGPFKDSHNYLVTTTDIQGDWSEPIYLNSSGFDPSLFHDDDGRKWLLNMRWDHRISKNQFSGILLQEYDPNSQKLVGEIKNIFAGSAIGLVEGPHIYKRNGWYYLLTAEGGTSYEHAVTFARSRTLDGEYEIHPQNPILTSWKKSDLELRKAGHACLVQTQGDEWYLAHLCGRPLESNQERGYCPLGRETSLQAMEWRDDDWLYVRGGGNSPHSQVPAPRLEPHPWEIVPARDDFDQAELGLDWQSLRIPTDPSWLSLTERSGHLRLRGRESLISNHFQSLIGRRLQDFHATASRVDHVQLPRASHRLQHLMEHAFRRLQLQQVLHRLAHSGERQLVHEDDFLGHCRTFRDALGCVSQQFGRRDLRAGVQFHIGNGQLARMRIGFADGCGLGHPG